MILRSCAGDLEAALRAKAKRWHTGALVDVLVGARVGARLTPRFDGNQNVVLRQVALEQRDADQAVLQLTGGKVARTAEGAAAIVVNSARAAVLVARAVATAVAAVVAQRLSLRRSGAVVAWRVLRDKLWAALTRALAGSAQKEWAILALFRNVHLDHAALVQLRAADWARLAHPALRIALGVAVVAANRAEHELQAVVEARALTLQNNNRLDQRARADLERRTCGGVKERQRHELTARRQQVARHTQAGHRLGRTKAVARLDNFARLQHAQRTVLQDVAKFIGQLPAVVWQFGESRSHTLVPAVSGRVGLLVQTN